MGTKFTVFLLWKDLPFLDKESNLDITAAVAAVAAVIIHILTDECNKPQNMLQDYVVEDCSTDGTHKALAQAITTLPFLLYCCLLDLCPNAIKVYTVRTFQVFLQMNRSEQHFCKIPYLLQDPIQRLCQ